MTTTTATITSAPLPAEVETLMRTLRLPHARAVAADVLATARSQRWDPAEVLKALLAEEYIGTMLPCNVILQQSAEGEVEVSAVNPVASMQAIDNPALGAIAEEIQRKLQAVIGRL